MRESRGLATRLTVFCGLAVVGCSSPGTAGWASNEATLARAVQGLVADNDLQKALVPIRTLEAPAEVSLSSIDETFVDGGTFTQVFHFYQPDANGEAIAFELTANASVPTATSPMFQSVTLTSHPGEPDQIAQTLPDASGQVVYLGANSRQGWYRLEFKYVAPNGGGTLSFHARDVEDHPLKIAWTDPPSARSRVRATIEVERGSYAFLKGGAYRNADRAEYAFADDVTVDGRTLYRRSFDQGSFNFPLGWLTAGQHTLEFSLQASGYNPAKFWFGVNQKSFNPLNFSFEWSPAQFLYWGEMHTGDYDAWNEGVAFAQGANVVRGVRPPPVRRGTTFGITLEHQNLSGSGANAILRIYPLGTGSETNWPAVLAGDYAGGMYTQSGFETRYREQWRVTVPANAPVGRYVLRAYAPGGGRIGSDVAFYVIHNPYPQVASGAMSKQLLETFGYDEDEDGVDMNDAPFGSDSDAKRDHFTAIYYTGAPDSGEFSQDTKVTGAFRRTGDDQGFSVLDYAMAAGDGTATEFDTMRRVYRYVSQQRPYGGADGGQGDTSEWIVPSAEDATEPFRLEDATRLSRPGTEELQPAKAVCYTMAGILAAYARSAGIPSRAVTSYNLLGGWGEHAFTEVYVPDLPRHGGNTTSSASSPTSDTDPWYVFDATDPAGNSVPTWTTYSQAIAPRAQYGRAYQVLTGPFPMPVLATTTSLDWDPLETRTSNVWNVSSSYASGPEYWVTRSGVTGWLGYWEKDVYRISKTVNGAKRIRVRTLPHDGEFLQPKLCVGSAAEFPAVPARCANPSTSVELPNGESYVVVFSDTAPLPKLRGDSVQYILELEQ